MKLYTIEFFIEGPDDWTIHDIDMKLIRELKRSGIEWGTGEILNVENVYSDEE